FGDMPDVPEPVRAGLPVYGSRPGRPVREVPAASAARRGLGLRITEKRAAGETAAAAVEEGPTA
ncbi:DUF4255 domain-containing protein, partial [Streptomyces sp. DT225]